MLLMSQKLVTSNIHRRRNYPCQPPGDEWEKSVPLIEDQGSTRVDPSVSPFPSHPKKRGKITPVGLRDEGSHRR